MQLMFLLLGIVFATIGLYVVMMGVDAVRRGAGGPHKTLIASGIFLTMLGIGLAVS